MTREEAIDNLSVAFDECRDAIRRQAEAIKRMSEDVAKYSKTLRTFRVLAKTLPRQDRKSYVSPYAKFDKMRRKRK